MIHKELEMFSNLTRPQLLKLCKGMTIRQTWNFLREIQEALAAYAKAYPLSHDLQLRVLRLMCKVEAWARNDFMIYARERAWKEKPELLNRDKQATKEIVRKAYEYEYAKNAY